MGLFDATKMTTETVIIEAKKKYNRAMRKRGSFVLIDKKGRFGKYDEKKKGCKFKKLKIEDATRYNFDAIINIWGLMGFTANYQIKRVHVGPGYVLSLV